MKILDHLILEPLYINRHSQLMLLLVTYPCYRVMTRCAFSLQVYNELGRDYESDLIAKISDSVLVVIFITVHVILRALQMHFVLPTKQYGEECWYSMLP